MYIKSCDMKKIYTVVLVMFISFLCFGWLWTYADISGNKLSTDLTLKETMINDIESTKLRFCNEWLIEEKLTPNAVISLRPGQTKKMCFVLFNNMPKDMNFYIWFTEAHKNQYGEYSCEANVMDNNFSKYIRKYEADMKIFVKGGTQIYHKFNLKIPTTQTGNVYGCLSYTIDGWYNYNSGDIFAIMVRKVSPIEVVVTGSVYNLWRRDDSKELLVNNKATIAKILVAIFSVWLISTILKTTKHKPTKKK